MLEELVERLAPSATNVLQYHNDNGNTGQNLTETSLTPTNVNSTSFGKLFSTTVDGQVYAQPLVVAGVNITTGSQQGTHDVVYVATEHDSLYAIDANTGAILWHDTLLPSRYGGTVTTVPSSEVNSTILTPEIGITATPVIDPTTNAIYIEEKTKEVTGGVIHYVHWLQALDLGSGAAKFGGPVVIADSAGGTYVSGPTVDGTGANPAGAPAGKVAFDAKTQLDRPALTLANGSIYMSFASHDDVGPYHGWVLGYGASTLAPTAVFNATPNGSDGGIWQSGVALAADSSGNLYFETGNGTFDTTMNSSGFPVNGDFGDSFVKLSVDPNSTASNQNGNLNGWGLRATDYFTPFNQATLDTGDVDLGSGGPFLLPASVGSSAHQNLLVGSGKEGRIYLIDTNNMGHFSPNADNIVEELPAGTINASFGTGSYYNGQIYYIGAGFNGVPDPAESFSISNAQLSTTPTTQGSDTFAYPGNSGAISADGSNNGILWAVEFGSKQLRAYNASNLATELYTSAQAANSRDSLGSAVKFAVPTVANGDVYVGTSNALVGYGLLTQATRPPAAPGNLSATAASTSVINLTWTDHDTAPNSATGYAIEESTNGTTFTRVATAGAGASSFSVTGLRSSTTYTFRIRAFNTIGRSAYSKTASATTPTLPVTPTRFHPTLDTPTGVDLEWVNHASNATGVSIFRAQGANSPVTVAVLSSQVDSFFDTGLTPGRQYTYSIQAFNSAGASPLQSFTIVTPASTAAGFSAHIDFTGNAANVPTGYTADTGAAFGTQGSLTYGWLANGKPTNNSVNARDRNSAMSPDELHDDFIRLQKANSPNASWQIAVPNGTYEVHILTGDPGAINSVYSLNVNGVNVLTATPNSLNVWVEATKTITVTGGVITVTNGVGASNNKIDAIDIIPVATTAVAFANFASASGLALNGSASLNGNNLQLTDGGANEASSAFTVVPVRVTRFTNSFSFQLLNPNAEGFTFTLQGGAPTALGGAGGGLGYGPNPGTGASPTIARSVAVKFDLFNTAGEGVDSTGLYTNGAEPTVPAINLSSTGINLHSGDVFNVTMSYDGTTLTVAITDTATGATERHSYRVNIATTIGNHRAYVGFTASTGGESATQNILDWTFTPL
jgi:hypothetical protein